MAGGIQPMGERLEFRATQKTDLDRQLVKSEFATVLVPTLGFEIPPQTQKGTVSTIQGIISKAAADLATGQPVRRHMDPSTAEKIDQVIASLESLAAGSNLPFELVLDDPSGNSFIENPLAPASDPQLVSTKYLRSREQLHQLGFFEEQSETTATDAKHGADLPAAFKPESDREVWDLAKPLEETTFGGAQISFNFECAHCGKEGSQNMCEVDIPGFRRCIIMAFVCDHCGARSNEVKPGGAIGKEARKFTLTIESEQDLSRDVLKSDTASLEIPDLELKLEAGTLGGVFTTIEGLLVKIADELTVKNPFVGDSALPERKARIEQIINGLRERAAGKKIAFHYRIGRCCRPLSYRETWRGDSSFGFQGRR
eukprot:Protomagalhaensia_sp_Gyna_25__666@NODE_1310_length_1957_cov_13_900417_g1045_i0_p1_GENE_NODE_1310_length_1957_cov_13_900417_g1045_i0NODE_1310_length_1957_cov_13_900417_g1045_i0_p1_ORF_typecomplete_len370_score63_01zfZPR1/PF03367_13/3_1e29zfZPR1/PF03367_13/4_6e44HypA/PF01155_19/0_12Rubredoxin_2/PF18073_1/25Rubredoxin_2/PF18073_1/1_2_NODE_1310_length_1957_cov_13_900417_g1045_i02601369